MKFSTLALLIILIFVLLSFTTMGSSTYVPYMKDMLFSNMYPYEGFKSFKQSPTEYSTYPNNDTVDFKTNNSVDDATAVPQCRKLMGFNGLYCPTAISGDPTNPTDIFSKAAGDWKCESYGLMNSKGYLCLDQNMKTLLSTRGGNAGGV
jgi:hypothetical protein